MNLNRKIKNFQVTISSHLMISVPDFKELFYCYEVGELGNEHTHVGIVLVEEMSVNKIIDYISFYNGLERHQIDVKPHKNFGTIWGYHYGFGNKEACSPRPIWITKTEEEVKEMVTSRLMHKRNSSNMEVKEQTKFLLGQHPVESLRCGYIHLKGYKAFKRDYEEAMRDINDRYCEEEDEVPLAPKKRHHWFWGPSNTGKSTSAKLLAGSDKYFVVPRNNDWQFYNGEKVILIEEYKGKFWTVDTLQELCDMDNYQVNTKGGSKKLPRDGIIAITSRRSPEDLFADQDAEDVQGVLNRFFVHHKTIIYNSTTV